jgi:hypothetical protein
MRRFHLFEFEDQAWFPDFLRTAMTSYLATTYRITPFPRLWAERISKLASEGAVCEIVDLGSGAAGPIPLVLGELKKYGIQAHVTLTDLYPNAKRWSGPDAGIRYWSEPVDARSVPSALDGVRTMFAVFHHFRPEAAESILRDAFESRRPICVFEATSRSTPAIATAILIPLLVLLLTPRVRPFSWTQILFTYLLPILPLLIFWDGLVSQLRTYTVAELNEFTSALAAGYTWEAGLIEIPRLPAGVPYLIGRPDSAPCDCL